MEELISNDEYRLQAKNYLINNKVIECDFKYVTSEKAYGYRIHEDYMSLPAIYFLQKNTLIKNIIKKRNSKYQQLPEQYHIAREHFMKIKIDYTRANEYTNEKTQCYNDIVNDVYINLITWWEKPENINKAINSGFIHMLLRNRWINHIKKENIKNHKHSDVQPDWIIDDSYENEDLDSKYEDEILYELLEEKINDMHWYEQTLLQYSLQLDLKTISRKTNISYRSIRNTMSIIKNKLRN